MSLPIFHAFDEKNFGLLQTNWASQINPLLGNPVANGIILKNVALINGTTVVNHLLGRRLQGWVVTRQRAAASIYDLQDQNQMQNLTLVLSSSASVVVDIYVY